MRAPVTSIVQKLKKRSEIEAGEAALSELAACPLQFHVARDDDFSITVGITYADHNKWYAAGFRLVEFPGNCGILVSTGEFVDPDIQNRGIGQYLHRLRLHIARECGYTLMQCTTVAGNEVQEHILTKHGWRRIYEFVNTRTGNLCFQWVLEITQA